MPRGALTLVELLVAVAFVMSSINNARDSTQSVKCMNNLKQIGEMVKICCADSGDTRPPNNS